MLSSQKTHRGCFIWRGNLQSPVTLEMPQMGPLPSKNQRHGKDQGHVPNWSALLSLWNLDLCMYRQELDIEKLLCVGGRGHKEGKTRGGHGKTDRHCMLSFMWNLDLPCVYVQKERARGHWDEHEQNAMRRLKMSVMARTLPNNEFKSHICPQVSLSSAQNENADSPARCSQGRLS